MARWMTLLGLAAALLAGWGVYLFFSSDPVERSASLILFPDDQQIITAGEIIYKENCAACHGANLEGQVEDWRSPGPDGLMPAPPHDENGHTWHHAEEVLFAITKLGVAKAAGLSDYQSNMPAYEGVLTDAEIIAVLSFIKSTWPEEMRKGHDEMSELYSMEGESG